MIKANVTNTLLIGRYLLIDAAQVSVLIQDFENANRVPIINLFSLLNGKEGDVANRYSPLLIPVTQQNEDSLILLIEEIIGRNSQRCINIITSKLSFYELSKKLGNFLITSDEEGTEYLLRFYDTVVLTTLFEVLKEEQIQSLFYEIDEWHIYSRDSFVNLVEKSTSEKEQLVPSIVLTESQLKLLDSSVFRRILNDLQIEDKEEHNELLELAQKAYQSYGVNQIDDMELFLEIVYEMKLHKNNLPQLSKIMANTSLSVNERLLELEKLEG